MPVIGRRPPVFILENGEVATILSEHTQRGRGQLTLRDPISGKNIFHVSETPPKQERIAWLGVSVEGHFQKEPALTPVFIMPKDGDKGADLQELRYLRHAISLEGVVHRAAREIHVYWWTNTFTPLVKPETLEQCTPVNLSPVLTEYVAQYSTDPNPEVPPHIALQSGIGVDSSASSGGESADGVFARQGKVIFQLGQVTSLQSGQFEPPGVLPPNTRWRAVSLKLEAARRKPPEEFEPSPPGGGTSEGLVDRDEEQKGPFEEGSPKATVKISARIGIAQDANIENITWLDPFQWDSSGTLDSTYQTIDPDTVGTIKVYNGSVYLTEPIIAPKFIWLELETQISPLFYPPNKQASAYLSGLAVRLECTDKNDESIELLLSGTKEYPIPYTQSILEKEPHSKVVVKASTNFNFEVGEPPFDLGGSWPAVYNRHTLDYLLNAGGSANGKNYNPLISSSAWQGLPKLPGLIDRIAAEKIARAITLQAVESEMSEFTAHQHHQRELENLKFATRTLMYARGRLYDLLADEKPPKRQEIIRNTGTLKIGGSTPIPGFVGKEYKGERTFGIVNTVSIFPFAVEIPGYRVISTGATGHQFDVTGGTAPYEWTVRRTQSSKSNPAKNPLAGNDEIYPFNDFGELVNDEYPDGVQNGGLPDGMLLNKEGKLYGFPSRAGIFLFRLAVKDSKGKRGEATVRFIILDNESDKPPCYKEPTITRPTFDATITQSFINPIKSAPDYVSFITQLEVAGGTKPYKWFYTAPNIPFLKLARLDGTLTTTKESSDYETFKGLWISEVEVEDSGEPATCNTAPITVAVGVPYVAGELENENQSGGTNLLPEGDYVQNHPQRTYLILDPAIPVRGYPQGKNLTVRSTRGTTIRPDIMSGVYMGPGPLTGVSPGVATSIGVAGTYHENLSPAVIQSDWLNSNPCDLFKKMWDKFALNYDPDNPPSPPIEGLPVVTGSSIDEQTQPAKRIRPLWPV